jgi:hypothetical protein
MGSRRYWYMINSGQATPERAGLRSLRRRVWAISLPMLFVLGGLLVWAPVRAEAQVFAIGTINNTNVLVGTPITIQITITNTTGASSQLTWSLNSNPATSATIAPTNTAPQGSTTFNWTPTQPQSVTFTVSVSQLGTLNTAGTSFTVTATNNVEPVSQVVIDPILPQTVAEGTTLTFTNHAHATNNPSTPLLFRLINAPSGATLTNNSLTSGVFNWTPTSAQAATPSYTFREVVTVVGGSGSNYQDFQVTVTRTNDCADLDGFLAAVEQGGYFQLSNCTTIVLTNTLRISKSVTLDGGTNNVTIAGNDLFRLFTVLPGVTNFTLRGITLSGGQDANGGGIYISSGAVATLTNCTFIGNSAVGTNGAAGRNGSGGGTIGNNGGNGTAGVQALGGAIYNLGGLTIYNSSFFTNSVTGGNGGNGGNGSDGTFQGGNGGNGGAGGLGYGGAIYNLGTLRITNCTFSGNTVSGGSGGSGGANGAGPFAGNAGRGGAGAPGSGAAVYSAQSLTAINCTFSLNSAQSGSSAAGGTDSSSGSGVNGPSGASSYGGGICLRGVGALTNCTFATNIVIGGNGGDGGDANGISGITSGNGGNGGNGFGGGLYNTGAVVVVNCTFSGCGAAGGTNGVGGSVAFPGTDGAPGAGHGGNIAQQGSGTFVLRNTILAATTAAANAYDTSTGRITDGGYNISSDGSLNLTGTSLKNADPKLGALADNGGLTPTMALQPTSPAINKIPKASSPATDQRGIPRPQPQGGLSDIGAYELVRLPAILAQPQSQTNIINTYVTFTVSAFGDALSYQWRFNAEDITDATASSYTIDSVGTTDTGDYDVVITNSFGSVTSMVASLTVIEPPEITTQPTDLSVVQGSNATFTVEATGLEPLYYQWQFNGTNISAATATSYAVINAQLSNAGNYTVVITNADGSVTSTQAVLTVGVSPSIAVQPADQTVVAGSNATFMVAATGTSVLRYQWRFNGTNISGATSSVTTKSSATTNNAGNYDVVVTNNFGMITSHTAKLTVLVPLPLIINGRITNGADGLGGVKVTVSGVTNSGITDFNGYYAISSLPTNTYTVTPALACFRFSPSNQVVHVGPNNTNGVNFAASSDLHLIRGRIIEYTNALSGVTVIVTGGGETNSLITDTNGYYTLSGLCSNTYSVTPSLRCYRFNPASQSLQLGSDTTNVNFVAGLLAYTISGGISNGSAAMSGVRVAIGDAYGTNTVTSTNGSFSVSGLCPGTYSVTPSLAGFAFDPGSTSITVGPDVTAVNFLASSIFNISGRVTAGANSVSGVSVTAGTNNATTDSTGNYTIPGVRAGPIIVTPSLACYRFNPASVAFTLSSNTTGVSFSATQGFAIHGVITEGSNGLSGVTVSAGGKSTVTTNGSYTLSGLCSNTYTVTPSLSGYQFEPGSTDVTLSSADSNGVNFAAFTLFSISGRILEGTNGLGGVNLGVGTNITAPDGSYTISGLRAGTNILTPSLGCYSFDPTNRVVIVGPSTNSQDFKASLSLYTISGRVTEGARGFSGVAVQIGDTTIGTDVNGNYALSGLCPGTYPVIPSFPGYQFAPGTNNVTLSSANSNGVNFAAVAVFSVSGRVLEGTNGVGGVKVTMDANMGTNSVLTAFDGSFAFSGVPAGSVSINPSLDGYKFQPSVLDLTIGADTDLPAFTTFPLLTISRTNALVQLAAAQTPGRTYQLEASTNLINWIPIFTTSNVSTNTTWFYFTDPYATNSVRYYRLAENVLVFPVFSMTLTNSSAQFSFVAFPELTYQIESSTNLLDWVSIFTTNNSSTDVALFQFTDSPAASRVRFYRLSQTTGL